MIFLLMMAAICVTLKPVEAEAASVNDLTFELNSDGTGYTVFSCSYTASGALTIPSTYNGKPVTRLRNAAFLRSSGLTSVTIPASVTKIDDYCFSGCSNLTGIWVDKDNPNYASDSFGVLFNKDKTILMEAPGAIKSYTIPNSVISIGEGAFSHRSSLRTVVIPSSVTQIGNLAFYDCKNLTSVTVPDSVTSMGYWVFHSCEKLTTATIGAGVSTIESSTFADCSSLTTVTIPASVTSIGYGAFEACTSLRVVYYGGDQNQFARINIESNNAELFNAEVVCASVSTPEPMTTPTFQRPAEDNLADEDDRGDDASEKDENGISTTMLIVVVVVAVFVAVAASAVVTVAIIKKKT